jgi:hypothetical protein
MPLLLPNLDDRSWADIADEARSLIPVYGPEWTDHNASDPGITLLELLAWLTEMDIYGLNQIVDAERLRFLNLVGVRLKGPRPAHAVLGFSPKAGTPTLPQSLEFSGQDANKVESRYQTLRSVTLAPASLTALQSSGPGGFQNLTSAWKRHSNLSPFGTDPQVGAAFYLGLSDPLPVNSPVSLYFSFGDGRSGWKYREELVARLKKEANSCQPPVNPCSCAHSKVITTRTSKNGSESLTHHGVRTVWEFLTVSRGKQQWVSLEGGSNQVVDETRSFTLDGLLTVEVATTIPRLQLGAVGAPLCYLRCRIDAGRYDAAPVLSDVVFNAVPVVQKTGASSTFPIAPNCVISYGSDGPPKPMDQSAVRIRFDGTQRIAQLDFTRHTEADPLFTVLDFRPPKDQSEGSLTLLASFLGYGNGLPMQQVSLPNAPAIRESVRLYTQERGHWHAWELREDFFASTRRDSHAVLDPASGVVTFGDGEHGRVPPCHKKSSTDSSDCLIFATSDATRAQGGKLGAGQINTLVDSMYNRALLSSRGTNPNGWSTLQSQLAQITNPLPTSSGAAAETLQLAAARANTLIESTERAVLLEDCERLALATPGTRIARVTAIANLHPDFPCYKAPGMISVIVLPYLPQGRPTPTAGLIHSVSGFLSAHRVVGTRIEVVGPTYLEIAVQATVRSKQGADKSTLQTNAVRALNDFFDPLIGGPGQTGWPFGRSVYRSEVLKILSEVDSVDCVTSLQLTADGGAGQCGNVCLGPTWLVVAGVHTIQVL